MKNDKMGFLGRYIANNVNLADPQASTRWNILSNYFIKLYSDNVFNQFNQPELIEELLRILKNEDEPDKLMRFGRNLSALLNIIDRSINNIDNNKLLKLIELYSETTIASNDNRAIDLAKDIIEQIIKYQKDEL